MSNLILKIKEIPTEFWELRNKGGQELYLQAALYALRKAKQITSLTERLRDCAAIQNKSLKTPVSPS